MKVRFGPFVFDPATRELLRDGHAVRLSPKAFDLLHVLIERRPALVTKQELQDRLWPDVIVVEANLANSIVEVRKALGDNPKSPTYIATVSRRGYRFSAAAEELGGTESRPDRLSARWWLEWKGTILPLADGENIIGRNPTSGVWIDGSSVSRVHARIVIAGDRATLEDRGSTNGTFVNGSPVASPHVLVDGTEVGFGSERAVFRARSDEAAPETERVRPPA